MIDSTHKLRRYEVVRVLMMTDADSAEPSTSTGNGKIKVKSCRVCGGQALGYNFGAICCEPCKAFFRRNYSKVYRGRCEGKCNVDVQNRQYCKHCRLKKCFAVGMRMKAASGEDQQLHPSLPVDGCGTNLGGRRVEDVLDASEVSLLESLLVITSSPGKDWEIEGTYEFKEVVNLADYGVRVLITFAKSIKEFKELTKEDQVALLKGSMLELLIIGSVFSYDPDNKQWVNNGKELKSGEHLCNQLESDGYHSLISEMSKITCGDKHIVCLLRLVCLFSSDRPNLSDCEKVDKAQQYFASLLEKVVNFLYPDQRLFPKLINALCTLRSVGDRIAGRILEVGVMNPLLIEVFGIA